MNDQDLRAEQDRLIEEATGRPRQFHEDENGYRFLYVAPDGRVMALLGFIYTTAIVADLDTWGYADRWCYHTAEDAADAYFAWIANGCQGEPEAWHRHPATGRRVFENHCEIYL